MNKIKYLKLLPPLVLVISYIFPFSVAASDVSSAAYTAGIKVTNTSSATIENATVILNLDAENLKDQYYTNSSLTGAVIRNADNQDMMYMPPVSSESNEWRIWVPSIIPGNEDWNMYLSQENMQPSQVIMPGSTGIQAAASTSLNLATSNWEINLNNTHIKSNNNDLFLDIAGNQIYQNRIVSAKNYPGGDIADLVYGNGIYAGIINNTNQVLISNDGALWQTKTLPSALSLGAIVYSDIDGFVIVGKNSETGYVTRDFNSYTAFTISGRPTNASTIRMVYGGNTLILTMDGATYVAESATGTWTKKNSQLSLIAASNNVAAYAVVVFGTYRGGNDVYTFKNGSQIGSKSQAASYYNFRPNLYATSDAIYFYCMNHYYSDGWSSGGSAKNIRWKTTDGTSFSTGFGTSATDVDRQNFMKKIGPYSMYISGSSIYYASDGWNFTTITPPITPKAITYNNGTYVIAGSGANQFYFSTDLVNWTQPADPVYNLNTQIQGNNIKLSYDNNTLSIYQDGQLNTALNLPMYSSSTYKFPTEATIDYIENIQVKVNNNTVADWSFNPDGVLIDRSGNGNNATTDYSAASNTNITLSMQSINPVKVNEAEDGGDDSGGVQIIDPESDPIVLPDTDDENWDKIPVFKDLAKDIRAEDWPVDLILSLVVVLLDMIICFIVYRFTRNQLTSGVIALVFLGYFTVMGCIPIFALVVSIVSEIAIMTKRKVISY